MMPSLSLMAKKHGLLPPPSLFVVASEFKEAILDEIEMLDLDAHSTENSAIYETPAEERHIFCGRFLP